MVDREPLPPRKKAKPKRKKKKARQPTVKRGPGHPPHVPTLASRMLVRMLKIADTKPDGSRRTKEDIAKAIGIDSPHTFDKYYRTEWLTARMEVDAIITHTFLEKAIGGLIEIDAKGAVKFMRDFEKADGTSQRFYLERMMGWTAPKDPSDDNDKSVKVVITGGLPNK
jgi:hypothetical protein